ncbi:MAG: hypothetical protein OXC48_09390, partial [Endozoicomonadaceae bacterium]|nr:hypothetical protein [Endozoicomonadaceae bacterium]
AEMAVSVAAGISGLLPFAITNEAEEVEGIHMFTIPRMLRLKQMETEENPSTIATGNSGSSTRSVSAIGSFTYADVASNTHANVAEKPVVKFSFFDYYNYVLPQTFQLDSMQDVVKTWTSLQGAILKINVACDTGVILLAHMLTRQTLSLNELDEFLYVRQQCSDVDMSVSIKKLYLQALSKIMDKTLSSPFRVGMFHHGYLLFSCTPSKYMWVLGHHHTTILEKIDFNMNYRRLFKVYEFSIDEIQQKEVTSETLANDILHFPGYENYLIFIGYASLK